MYIVQWEKAILYLSVFKKLLVASKRKLKSQVYYYTEELYIDTGKKNRAASTTMQKAMQGFPRGIRIPILLFFLLLIMLVCFIYSFHSSSDKVHQLVGQIEKLIETERAEQLLCNIKEEQPAEQQPAEQQVYKSTNN